MEQGVLQLRLDPFQRTSERMRRSMNRSPGMRFSSAGSMVLRNGVVIGGTRLPSYSDRDLAGSTTYAYAVLAINGTGRNDSLESVFSLC